ncbi:MAG: hypothetical protein JEZ07_01925 [Phycisphaerae bacterium]|nr:hypothetical protein [Phycisphaerae bacterium]
MIITVNNLKINCDTTDKTLAVVLSQLQQEYIGNNEVIVNILIDGQGLTGDQLGQYKDKSADDFEKIEIFCQSRSSYAAYGLKTMAQQITDSNQQRQEIAKILQQGNTLAAMEKMISYLSIWSSMQETLGSACRLMDVQIDQITITNNDMTITQQISQLSEKLQEIKTALQSGDLVLLGDFVEYEFEDITTQWQETLNQLANHFEA